MKLFLVLTTLLGLFGSLSVSAFPLSYPQEALQEPGDDDDAPKTKYNFEAIVKFDNCSGSLVRFETSENSDKALVLTNGHCVQFSRFSHFMPQDHFMSHKPVDRRVYLLDPAEEKTFATLHTTEIVYATMTGTDVAFYEVSLTYGEIEKQFGVKALTMSPKASKPADAVQVVSGLFRSGLSCDVERIVPKIKEAGYVWTQSPKLGKECTLISGMSGSPVLSLDHQIVGIANTGNEDGEKCTLNNPCEVEDDGSVRVDKGRNYGQQTHLVYSCLNKLRQIDVSVPGCSLFHENARSFKAALN